MRVLRSIWLVSIVVLCACQKFTSTVPQTAVDPAVRGALSRSGPFCAGKCLAGDSGPECAAVTMRSSSEVGWITSVRNESPPANGALSSSCRDIIQWLAGSSREGTYEIWECPVRTNEEGQVVVAASADQPCDARLVKVQNKGAALNERLPVANENHDDPASWSHGKTLATARSLSR